MIKVIRNLWIKLYLIFSDKTFPLIGNKSALTTSFQYYTRSLSVIKQEK